MENNASLEQVLAALEKADAAGDVEGAKELASLAQSLMGSQNTQSQQTEPVATKQSVLGSILGMQPRPVQQSPLDQVDKEDTRTDLTKSLEEFWMPEAGALGGALAGFKTGVAMTPPIPQAKFAGGLAGAAIGAGAGFMAGSVPRLIDDPNYDITQAFKDSGEAAAWEAGGGLVVKGIGTIAAPFVKEAGVSNMDAKQAAQAILQKYDATLLKSMVSESSLDKAIDSLAVSGIGGRFGAVQNNSIKIGNALKAEVENMLSRRGGGGIPSSEVAVQINNSMSKAKNALYSQYGQMMDEVIRANNITVNTAPIKGHAEAIINMAQSGKRPVVPELLTTANQLKNIMADGLTADELKAWRSSIVDLQNLMRQGGIKDSEQYALAKQMSEVFDKTLDGAIAKNANPDDVARFREMQNYYRQSITELDSDVMKTLAKRPETLGTLFATGNSNLKMADVYTAFHRAKKVDPDFDLKGSIKTVQASYLEQLLKSQLPSNLEGEAVTQHLNTVAKKLNDPRQKATMVEVMGELGSKRLMNLLDTARIVEGGQPKGMLELLIAGKQSQAVKGVGTLATLGAIGGAASQGALGATAAITVAAVPKVLSFVAVDPARTNKFLQLDEALKSAPPYGFKRAALTSRALQWLNENIPELYPEMIENEQSNPVLNQGKMQSTM